MSGRLQQLGHQYGGFGAGSGISSAPVIGNPNKGITYFNPETNQHFQYDGGQVKVIGKDHTAHQSFAGKIGSVISEGAHIAGQVASAGGKFVLHSVEDIITAGAQAAKFVPDLVSSEFNTAKSHEQLGKITEKQHQINADYRAGKISKSDYMSKLKDISKALDDNSALNTKAMDQAGRIKQDAAAVAETAVNLFTLGKARTVESAGKTLLTGEDNILTKVGKALEGAASKVPAVKDLYARNSVPLSLEGENVAQSMIRNSKQVAFGLLIKRPIFYQTNIGLAQDVYKDILDGDYTSAVKDAAWIGAQAVSGGPLGWAARQGHKVTSKLRELVSGKNSFIDEISKKIGNGSPAQITNYLDSLPKDSKEYKEAVKTLKIAQEVNLQATSDDAIRAAESVTSHYDQHGINLAELTPQQLIEDLNRWSQADEIARHLSPKDGPIEYVAVRWDTKAKTALAKEVEAAGDNYQAMADAVSKISAQPGVGWGNNNILMAKIMSSIAHSGSAKEAAATIREISTVSTLAKDIPVNLAKKLDELGYSIAEPFGGRKTPKVDLKDTRKLVTAVTKGDSEIFDEAIAPQPALETLMTPLRKFGLTPESNTQIAYEKLSDTLVSNLDQLHASEGLGLASGDKTSGGKFILSKLQEYVNKQQPNPYLNVLVAGRSQQSALQDIRQMNLKEITEALDGISRQDAKSIQKAVLKAYTDVPLEFRGLGIKAFDMAYRVPGFKTYSRIQSALRYTYNPFFRTQEVFETKILSHMKANNLVWMKSRSELNQAAKLLDESQLFTTGYTGEATQDLTLGRLHANLLKTQKRDLAGLSLDIAEKKGLTLQQMVQDHPDELADALRVIVQYPTKGALNSPLARTLNIAFFPMRYNLKVAGMVAQEVSKLPPTVQTAFIHSMFKMSDWLKSPEGIQWQSDNSDAIQIFSYFSIMNNIQSVLNRLHGKPSSIGDVGLLGGLPFGFISQILDAEGIINLNTPYLNPKTGEIVPEYIPQTTKARAATALEGLLNTMFTYPGRVIGLPGKASQLRKLTGMFIDTTGADYQARTRTNDLTPLQQKWHQVLSDPNVKQSQIDELYTTPAPGEFKWYTLPPLAIPHVMTDEQKNAMKASQKKGRKGKKHALPIPARGQQLQ